jgi:hypothetical protein
MEMSEPAPGPVSLVVVVDTSEEASSVPESSDPHPAMSRMAIATMARVAVIRSMLCLPLVEVARRVLSTEIRVGHAPGLRRRIIQPQGCGTVRW